MSNDASRKKPNIIIIIIAILLLCCLAGALIVKKVNDSREPGWHKTDSDRAYYVKSDGQKARGYQLIEDKAYLFDEDGRIVSEPGWYNKHGEKDEAGSDYYCEGNGKLACGWKYLDKKVWYFYQKTDEEISGDNNLSKLARGYTTSGKIEIPESGYIDGDEGLALAYGMSVLNKFGWNLRSAYKYSGSLEFEQPPEDNYGLTIHSCANYGFKNGSGNCLVWSGTFCVMARLLGHDCRQVWGTLVWNGVRPHAWTEIWDEEDPTDDEIAVFDPRKNKGEGFAGFNVRYGQKGTYRYNLHDRKYLEF